MTPGAVIVGANRGDIYTPLTTSGGFRIGDAHTAGDNGWMLDAQQNYDPGDRTLYKGNGTVRTADDINDGILRRVAGNGGCCYNGEGLSALNAQLNFPQALKIASDGGVYLAESRRVRMFMPNGTIQTVAGNGLCCYSGDGGPATSAAMNIADIAVTADGTLYIADFSNRVRMVRNGVITTIAGTGTCCSSGDDGPALNAKVSPQGITVDNDGTIYFSEQSGTSAGVIRRITPDGIVSHYADVGRIRGLSTGVDGAIYFTDFGLGQVFRLRKDGRTELVAGRSDCATNFVIGDGGKATSACLKGPWFATADRNGTVYVAEQNGARVRAVTPDGIIRTVAGTGQSRGAKLKDVLPATASVTDAPFGIAAHPDGTIYFTDWDLDVVWRLEPKLPGASPSGDILIPAESGASVSVFHGSQHLRTVDAMTGVTLRTFAYDSELRPIAVTDRDGNVTTLERDAGGNLTGILAANGQRTAITTADGVITKITNPAGGAYRFDYYAGALMKTMTTPRGMTTSFTYDEQGRLTRDTDAANGYQALVRTGTPTHFIINLGTAENHTSTFDVEYLGDGGMTRINTSPAGEISRTDTAANGTETRTLPDGGSTVSVFGPDSRFGMAAPGSSTITTKSGALTLITSSSRQATLSNPNDVLSLTSLATTRTVNGRNWTSNWAAPTRTITGRSPMGRTSKTTFDTKGRVISMETTGFLPMTYLYDETGHVKAMSRGTRTTTFAYDDRRYLASTTDPIGRSVSFMRDDLGRVTQETFSDGRVIRFAYDADGNIASITPPGRPLHTFNSTSVNLLGAYLPPTVPGTGGTLYTYNRDRQLTSLQRPDGVSVNFNHDTAGRLASIAAPNDSYQFVYAPITGTLSSIGYTRGASLAFTYDGSLPKSVTWSGAISATITYSYDNTFRVISENGVGFTYDNDNLLVAAGTLTLSRDAQNGAITAATVGAIGDTWTRNSFGEIATHGATFDTNPIYNETLTRDDGGRITARDETLLGAPTHEEFTYDDAGRLQKVIRNGATTTYTYDVNGNRTLVSVAGGNEAATYDDQDRLVTRGAATYTYTGNGELLTKGDPTGTTTYTYDPLGNLRQVMLPSGTAIEYVIDGRNRRVGKKVNGVLVAGWLYSGQHRIVAEIDGSGAVVSKFVYGSRGNVPDYMVRDGVTYRILTDHLGSPRALVDASSGTVVQMIGYDEYGNVLGDTRPGFQPFGFAGGLYDSDTKLVRFGARDYDPQSGRWTVKDPIRFDAGDANIYAYASDDPVNLLDPSGLSWTDDAMSWLADTAAGFGDKVSFGATRRLRDWEDEALGVESVDYCSAAYSIGEYGGAAEQTALMWAGSLNGGASSVFWAGAEEGALAEAKALGGTTLEQTALGGLMDTVQNTYGYKLPTLLWDAASATFAMNASEATAVIRGAGPTWTGIEARILAIRGITPTFVP